MSIPFDERKATEAAALLLRLRGGRMHYLKLIKLLYLADRTALLQWGFPITTDSYVSMDHGPVTSHIYNLIVDEVPKPFWSKYISEPKGDHEVTLVAEAPVDRLSRAEEKLITEVFNEFGHRNRWEIVEHVHRLPEWRNPYGSSIPIHIREILDAGGISTQEIEAILQELHAEAEARRAIQTSIAS